MASVSNCGAFQVNGEFTSSALANTTVDFSVEVVILNQDTVDHDVTAVVRVGGQELGRASLRVSPPGEDVRISGTITTGTADLDVVAELVRDVRIEPEPAPEPEPECTTDADCPTGEICSGGDCVPAPEPEPECTTDGDCGVCEICVNGSCEPECTSAGDCAAGETCLGGCCVPEELRQIPSPSSASLQQRFHRDRARLDPLRG